MRFFTTVVLAFSIASTAHGFCGTKAGSKEERDEIQREIQSLPQSKIDVTNRTLSKDIAFTVPVVWHVFTNENDSNDGFVPDRIINEEHDVINYFFRQVGLSFGLESIERYSVPYGILHGVIEGNRAEEIIKSRRQGDRQTLNIYTVSEFADDGSPGTLLGFATFPDEYQGDPQNDGIVIKYDSLPHGSFTPANSGKALVHEIGHWVGLYHTFQDGCSNGDYVNDTPAESDNKNTPPVGPDCTPRDSCPFAPGLDPIGMCLAVSCASQTNDKVDNIMDYTPEVCKKRFTPGQYNRMALQLLRYRDINLY